MVSNTKLYADEGQICISSSELSPQFKTNLSDRLFNASLWTKQTENDLTWFSAIIT